MSDKLRDYERTVSIRYNDRRAPSIHLSTYKTAIVVWFPGATNAVWLQAADACDLAGALIAAARRRRALDAAEKKELRKWKRGR